MLSGIALKFYDSAFIDNHTEDHDEDLISTRFQSFWSAVHKKEVLA
jgi:hypothetical protein